MYTFNKDLNKYLAIINKYLLKGLPLLLNLLNNPAN